MAHRCRGFERIQKQRNECDQTVGSTQRFHQIEDHAWLKGGHRPANGFQIQRATQCGGLASQLFQRQRDGFALGQDVLFINRRMVVRRVVQNEDFHLKARTGEAEGRLAADSTMRWINSR